MRQFFLASAMILAASVSAGNFTADNIGTQLFSPDYIDLATFGLSSRSGKTLVVTLTGTGSTSPCGLVT